jgi:hypothetical protein
MELNDLNKTQSVSVNDIQPVAEENIYENSSPAKSLRVSLPQNSRKSTLENFQNNETLLYQQMTIVPASFEKILGEIFNRKKTELDRVNAKMNSEAERRREKVQELTRLNGVIVQHNNTSSFCQNLSEKIRMDMFSNLDEANKVFYFDSNAQFKDPFEMIFDIDSKHEMVESSMPQFFDAVQVDQLLTDQRLIFRILLDDFSIDFSRSFNSIEVLYSILLDKVAKYHCFLRNNLSDLNGKDDKVKLKLQRSVFKIHSLWNAIKQHDKFDQFSNSKHFKRLVAKKFTNKHNKEDFVIEWSDSKQGGELKNQNGRKKELEFRNPRTFKLRIFIDGVFVDETEPFVVTKKISIAREFNLVLSRKPQVLKIECFERFVFWKLVDEQHLMVSVQQVLREEILTDKFQTLRFTHKSAKANLNNRCFDLVNQGAVKIADKLIEVVSDEDNKQNRAENAEQQLDVTQDTVEKEMSKYKMLRLDEETSLSVGLFTGFVISRGQEPLSKMKTNRKRGEELHNKSHRNHDYNDPRSCFSFPKDSNEDLEDLKQRDERIAYSDNPSMRFAVVRFNKQFKSKLPLFLSHKRLAEEGVMNQLENDMANVSAMKKEFAFLRELKGRLADASFGRYFPDDLLHKQMAVFKRIEASLLRNMHCKNESDAPDLGLIVKEFAFDDGPSPFGLLLKELLSPHRKFKPEVRQISSIKIQENKQFALVGNFFKGFNFPIRKSGEASLVGQTRTLIPKRLATLGQEKSIPMMGRTVSQSKGNATIPVQMIQNNIFVKVVTDFGGFQEVSVSEAVSGSDPSWNFHIEREVDLRGVDEKDFFEVKNHLGSICIHLFDDFQVADNRDFANRIVTKIERRFLCSLSLPVIDILRRGRVAGNFRLAKPVIVFGYKNTRSQNHNYFGRHDLTQKSKQNQAEFAKRNDLKFANQEIIENKAEEQLPDNNMNGLISSNLAKPNTLGNQHPVTESVMLDILNPFIHTSIDLRINVDPLVRFDSKFWQPKSDFEYHDRLVEGSLKLIGPDRHLLARLQSFLNDAKHRHLEQRVFLLTELLNGEVAFVHHFLHSNPPCALLDSSFDKNDPFVFKKLAYVVSLIQTEENGRELHNVSIDNQAVLDCLKARNCEKAFLLANLMKAVVGSECANDVNVLIGSDRVGKRVAVVLVSKNSFWEIWNPENSDCIVFQQTSVSKGFFSIFGDNQSFKTEVLNQHDFEMPFERVLQIITCENVFVFANEDNEFTAVDFRFRKNNSWVSVFDQKGEFISTKNRFSVSNNGN